jgi:hypothetical protein
MLLNVLLFVEMELKKLQKIARTAQLICQFVQVYVVTEKQITEKNATIEKAIEMMVSVLSLVQNLIQTTQNAEMELLIKMKRVLLVLWTFETYVFNQGLLLAEMVK